MGVVLPDELAYVLDLIGVSWPNVDEDDYRHMATALREFADDIDNGGLDAHGAVQELLGANEGAAIEAFAAHWDKVKNIHLANLAEAGRIIAAVALDGVAIAVEVAKGAAIIQLGILAVEIASAVAAAPFTLGLSSLAGAAGTQATRMIVKKIFREVVNQVVDQLLSVATAPIYAALESMASDLAIQLTSNALGLQRTSTSAAPRRPARAGSARASTARSTRPAVSPSPVRAAVAVADPAAVMPAAAANSARTAIVTTGSTRPSTASGVASTRNQPTSWTASNAQYSPWEPRRSRGDWRPRRPGAAAGRR